MPHLHHPERSETVVTDAGALRFVATCSCGWRSEPTGPNRIDLAWDDHLVGLGRFELPTS